VVAHIDHVKEIAGVDAIGIGSDFDGIDCAPEGLEDVSKFQASPGLCWRRAIQRRTFKKIYGGNTLRLMRQVEKVAAGLQ
jgi:membrane dipeptidase